VQVHCLGVAGRQDQGRALALVRANSAEDAGGGGTLVTRCDWTGAALRPPSGDLVLCFIVKSCGWFLANFYQLPAADVVAVGHVGNALALSIMSRARMFAGTSGWTTLWLYQVDR
jgi:hypothetical protein